MFFSCREPQQWLTVWKQLFPCMEAENGTSTETFNLSSVNTATGSGVKSQLSHFPGKQFCFQLQLQDSFLEAGISSLSFVCREQTEAFILRWTGRIDCNPKTEPESPTYAQRKRDHIMRSFTTEKVFIAASFQLTCCTYWCIAISSISETNNMKTA